MCVSMEKKNARGPPHGRPGTFFHGLSGAMSVRRVRQPQGLRFVRPKI